MAEQEPEQLPLDPALEAEPSVEPGQAASQTEASVVEEAETSHSQPAPAPEPEEDFREQAQREREERIRLEERLRAQEAAAPAAQEPEPPKTYTRQELRAAVNAGTIDEDAMEEVWAKQQRDLIKRETSELIERRDAARATETRVETDYQKYLEAYPDVKRVGSDDRTRLEREYDYYVSLGDPPGKTTELKAMRSVFGPPERVREKTRDARSTTPTTSGGTGGGAAGDRPVDIFNRIPTHLREHYRQQYNDGFKTLEVIEKELPYMKRTQ